MCGISGYLNTDHGIQLQVLKKMNTVIRHRGPDDEGYTLIGSSSRIDFRGEDTDPTLSLPQLESANGSHYFLGLGHRRLSIVDLSADGHQPMSLSGRDITVTYNGEIYNYLELREELTNLGYTFQTSCDTEVLLYAYCEWGEDCLNHFNGMWGFALWDGKEHKLFCARDRLGAKPFHYWHSGNHLLFGSELKQLCQDDSINKHFDTSYLAANLFYGVSDFNDQTLIENMHALPPGHKLVVRISDDHKKISSFNVDAYWKLDTTLDESRSYEEWMQLVAAEFSRSCNWRLRSDAPVAALLSGGLDSSCMVAELCSQFENPSSLSTFTTSYPGQSKCDEWYFADSLNQHCGCKGHLLTPDPSKDIEKRFEQIIWCIEGRGSLSFLGVKILLDHIHEQGFKVVLNGQCGDETMFGYERYYANFFLDLLKKGKISSAVREYLLASQHSAISAIDLLGMFVYFNLPSIHDFRRLRKTQSFVHNDLLNCRKKEELHTLLFPKTLQELQSTEITSTQLPHIVRFDDRLYMSASLEARVPFMDYRFVELSAKIPPHLKIKNGYTKNIMRDIFDSRMPKEVTWRTNKMGFGAPVSQWAAAFSKDYLMDQLQNAKTAPYFHTKHLEELVATQPTNSEIFEFLQFEQFARQFNVN